MKWQAPHNPTATTVNPLSGGMHPSQLVMGGLTLEDVPPRRPQRERDGKVAGLGQLILTLRGTEFVHQYSAITGRESWLPLALTSKKLFKAACSCAVSMLLTCSDVTAS